MEGTDVQYVISAVGSVFDEYGTLDFQKMSGDKIMPGSYQWLAQNSNTST